MGERLELVAGQNAVVLAELVHYGPKGYSVDREAIRQMVDAATTGDSRWLETQIVARWRPVLDVGPAKEVLRLRSG
jgi:hypothetical protein